MNIWFDLSNSPHINLFCSMIRDLEQEHRIIITCRPLANTIELLDLHGLSYKVVGKHYGAKFWKKVCGYPIRVFQLYSYLKDKAIDVAVSQSSFHSPIVARLLGAKSLYMNDNEYAMGNIPSFLFANKIFVPEFLDIKKVIRQGARPSKIVQYPGVKEGIYLYDFYDSFTPGKNKINKIFIRPEPWTAQYYKGAKNFFDDILLKVSDYAEIVLLPRGNEQAKYYKNEKFNKITIPERPLTLTQIVQDCSLFIGAGGTMTRELAVLGVPTISIYQDELLDVDRYLIQCGMMEHIKRLTADQVIEKLHNLKRNEIKTDIMDKGRKAYTLIKDTILKLGEEK